MSFCLYISTEISFYKKKIILIILNDSLKTKLERDISQRMILPSVF